MVEEQEEQEHLLVEVVDPYVMVVSVEMVGVHAVLLKSEGVVVGH